MDRAKKRQTRSTRPNFAPGPRNTQCMSGTARKRGRTEKVARCDRLNFCGSPSFELEPAIDYNYQRGYRNVICRRRSLGEHCRIGPVHALPEPECGRIGSVQMATIRPECGKGLQLHGGGGGGGGKLG